MTRDWAIRRGGGGGAEGHGVIIFFEPAKKVGLCSFDLHIVGGSSYLYTVVTRNSSLVFSINW